MYHFGMTKETVDYIVDDNPLKQGLLSPGLHIPVVHPKMIYVNKPDYVLVLAWNFAESIITKHREYIAQGGRFIVPLPELRIVKF